MSSLRRSLPTQQQPEQAPDVAPPAQEAEAPSTDEFRAQHDSGGHIDVGDSVGGEGVVVNGVTFSPGELAALVDYVGDLDALSGYAAWELLEMKHLLAARSEDTAAWDRVTDGAYSGRAQENDDHFAPGAGGGPSFESSFLDAFAAAFEAAQLAQEHGEDDGEYERLMTEARLHLYTAEHYLQDAFSAGHQVAASDVEASTEALMASFPVEQLYPMVATEVWVRESETISRYGYRVETPVGTIYDRIDSALQWVPLATAGALYTGRGAVVDAVRKTVHERLEAGVEVSSPAHPAPWVLPGDHDLFESDETVAALQLALSEVRSALELEAIPGVDPRAKAQQLFDRHRPVPTGAGQALVDETLADATANPVALAYTVADATCSTIDGVMDAIVAKSHGFIVEIPDTEEREEEPPAEAAPEELPSYVPGF